MGVFSISSQHGNDDPSTPTSTMATNLYGNHFDKHSNTPPSQASVPPSRKISVPVTFYSSTSNDAHFDTPKRNLEEAEAASDRRNLFSGIKLPSFASSKAHHHTVSPIKVQVSPAEPTRTSNATPIPSTVRITRRHTEHAGTLRKFTPPLQQVRKMFAILCKSKSILEKKYNFLFANNARKIAASFVYILASSCKNSLT